MEEAKRILIDKFQLKHEILTRHNRIYEGIEVVLIENLITSELKVKPRKRR